jgi:hypothetical protein
MAINVFPAPAAGKTRFVTTLTSGTSYTVPAGVTYVNVTLRGGGGGGGGASANIKLGGNGTGGAVVTTNLVTTPGASIAYAIGAGGAGGSSFAGTHGSSGGTTTFTGATSAGGGIGGVSTIDTPEFQPGASAINAQANGGTAAYRPFSGGTSPWVGGTGGAGSIDVEYWA